MDVLCLGNFVVDLVCKPIETMPEPGKMLPIESARISPGGCANNTAVALARLGVRTRVAGMVGDDVLGTFVLRNLEAEGIDTSGMAIGKNTTTSFTFVGVAETGERSFFHYIGANGQMTEENVDISRFQGIRLLHIGALYTLPNLGGRSLANITKRARELGILVSVDTAWKPDGNWSEDLEPLWQNMDIFIPSVDEARAISGLESPEEMAEYFLGKGVPMIGIKLGEDGCILATESESVFVPSFDVDVVDTVGAGDAWCAGLIAGVLQGKSLYEIGQLANAVGACCVSAAGATTGLRDLEETMKFVGLA